MSLPGPGDGCTTAPAESPAAPSRVSGVIPPASDVADLARLVVGSLADHGCSAVGVTGVEPFHGARRAIEETVASGRSGHLGFTFKRPYRSSDIRRSLPWAARLVVAARPYLPEAGSPGPAEPGTVRVARFSAVDGYTPLGVGLDAVAALLEQEGYRATVLVDDSRLVDRAAAVRAGVGWRGKSAMVLVPGAGPWVLLGSVATDAPLPITKPMRRTCGRCDACMPACPTGAIVAPGVVDARRCVSALLQAPGWIPRPLRAAVGDRFYGCDDCLEACPPGSRLLEAAAPTKGRHDAGALLGLDDGTLRRRFAGFYVPGNDARWLRRNLLVALGNSGGAAAVGMLAGYGGNGDPVLRGHAAWALGRIGSDGARAVLGVMAATETDVLVRQEVALASTGSLE